MSMAETDATIVAVVANDVRHIREQMDAFIERYTVGQADHEDRLRDIEHHVDRLQERVNLLTAVVGTVQTLLIAAAAWLGLKP
jgi:Mg2+ and Co2+ transporter CorA